MLPTFKDLCSVFYCIRILHKMYKYAITFYYDCYYYFKSNVNVIYYKIQLGHFHFNTKMLEKKIFDFQKHCHFDY